ncbi:MAG: DUF190 domain-containing protein [Saprospiraceae bacterium]|nr:hypothetical protein [Saprospirales bacterium]
MERDPNAKLLRIFIGESDKVGHQPLYEVLVLEARKAGIAGATVLRGTMGFGANSRIHTAKLFEISSDLPVVVEIVDSEENIRDFMNTVNELFEKAQCGGMVTLEKAEIIRYNPAKK